MGSLLRLKDNAPVIVPWADDGCFVEVVQATRLCFASLTLLALDPRSPLTPRAALSLELPPLRHARDVQVRLTADGVWWCGRRFAGPEVYLSLEPTGPRILTDKAEVYRRLGAVERLTAMGLEDAAVSLASGDFDRAAIQVIEARAPQGD